MEDIYKVVKEQKNNFQKLESKMKAIMKKCNKKTFTQAFDGTGDVIHARGVEEYLLDDGLYVYLFFNDDKECIDMLISATPVYEKYEFKDRNGNSHIGTKYTGASGIEYSFGGEFNSLFFDGNWYLQKQIGLFENVDGRMTKTASTIPTMAGGYDLQLSISGTINKYDCNNLSDFESYRDKCDIEGIIDNYQVRYNSNQSSVDKYKLCFEKVNNIAENKNKKSWLKKLLEIFKRNKNKIEEHNKGGMHI